MNLLELDARNTQAFFLRLTAAYPLPSDVAIVCVLHLVSNTPQFLRALDQLSTAGVGLIVVKKNSVDPTVENEIKDEFGPRMLREDDPKTWAADSGQVIAELKARNLDQGRVAFLDLGGYFASSLNGIVAGLPGVIVGLVEGTENGHARYVQLKAGGGWTLPLTSVAGSALKYPENHLVGVSVVHSVESVLRDHGQVLQSYRACVIGFGRVGRSAAEALRGRGVPTVVFEMNSIAQAEAAARGFRVFGNLRDALSRANLVICATGNRALSGDDFGYLSDRTFVATVTSADDELDLKGLETGWVVSNYDLRSGRGSVTEYYDGRERRFFLIDHGNAVNFLHGAVIGPAIRLIEGEKIIALARLDSGQGAVGSIGEVAKEDKEIVARTWLEHFLRDGVV